MILLRQQHVCFFFTHTRLTSLNILYAFHLQHNVNYQRSDTIQYLLTASSAVATVEATEAAASVKILTGAIIISVIKITIVNCQFNG